MPPKAPSPHADGLLEYLESVVGSDQFVERIERAYESVEALTDERASQLAHMTIPGRLVN